MRKTVDVYLKDRLIASYPVVAKAIDRPTDDDFVERIKQQMRAYYRGEDIRAGLESGAARPAATLAGANEYDASDIAKAIEQAHNG